MLAVSPLRSTKDEEGQGEMERLSMESHEFADLSDGNLLESINFDDIFVGINVGDVLPDLEMDPEIFAEFSLSAGEESEMATSSVSLENVNNKVDQNITTSTKKGEEDKVSSDSGFGSGSNSGEEIVSKRDESAVVKPSQKEADKGRKSSAESKNSQGKRKVKVDWTPELHRRFVQAVEQLGVDKAVPSRILEIMGIDCLTRHNIASHLQKYRSHRKHLLAREAEAANWSKRRQCYGIGGGGGKREGSPWLPVAPTIGFPPVTPPPPMQHFRALHVWGHPTVDHSFLPLWPKHLPPHSPSPPHLAWAPPVTPPPPNPSYWHQPAPNALTPGPACFPQPLTTTRFPSPPVPGIPPHAMYKVDPGIGVPTNQPSPRPFIDSHPSKESVDAAIGDVLSKPWLPLPLGLKAPELDSVMGELQRQGVPKIPPSCA
ncbi:probable transcription factor GLK1 [Neltuma alba]|uniref:probable transcription factor GLK1 n=1 Tax=Neltuma alba TaxID=207710 RepID=UPI0010A3CFB8|nr:probable transcription factor GLK1 [Prosopis alba]